MLKYVKLVHLVQLKCILFIPAQEQCGNSARPKIWRFRNSAKLSCCTPLMTCHVYLRQITHTHSQCETKNKIEIFFNSGDKYIKSTKERKILKTLTFTQASIHGGHECIRIQHTVHTLYKCSQAEHYTRWCFILMLLLMVLVVVFVYA